MQFSGQLQNLRYMTKSMWRNKKSD